MKRDAVCIPLRKLTNEKLVTLLTLCLALSMPATARAQAGQLDKSFGKNGIFNGLNTPPLASSQAAALTIQSDGKILITGQFQAPNGVIQPCVVRLTSGGTLDNSFGQQGVATVALGTAGMNCSPARLYRPMAKLWLPCRAAARTMRRCWSLPVSSPTAP